MRLTNPQDMHCCIWLWGELRLVFIDITRNDNRDFSKDIGIHFIRGEHWWNIYGIRWIRKDGLMVELTK